MSAQTGKPIEQGWCGLCNEPAIAGYCPQGNEPALSSLSVEKRAALAAAWHEGFGAGYDTGRASMNSAVR